MASDNDIVVAAARRTPMGAFLGQFTTLNATALGAAALQAALADSGVPADLIDEVIMGCVLPAGLGQAPARQAALAAGIPTSVGCTTVNKVCGSGMKSIMLGHDMIRAGSARIIAAGGMESMSNAPFLATGLRGGIRFGHQQLLDHMLYDGLQNAYDGLHMGEFAERCVDRFKFTREQQDAYATRSVQRALAAVESGGFDAEIAAVTVKHKGGDIEVTRDEQPFKCNVEKIPNLKPAFRREDGTVTAASSASISDGAAALILMSAAQAAAHGITPLARIVAHAGHARTPEEFTTAPIGAIGALVEYCGWRDADVDLYEINEAFAAVALAAIHELKLDPDKVNVSGGACALGHPIGASGARIVVTLIHALRARGLKRGIASLCIGGGEATAMALELV